MLVLESTSFFKPFQSGMMKQQYKLSSSLDDSSLDSDSEKASRYTSYLENI